MKGLPDAYDPSSPRQTFAHWDAPFIAWMEENRIEGDYCTDLDLHEGRSCVTDTASWSPPVTTNTGAPTSDAT